MLAEYIMCLFCGIKLESAHYINKEEPLMFKDNQ